MRQEFAGKMTQKLRILPECSASPATGSTLFVYLGSAALNRVSTEGLAGKSYVTLSALLHVCAYLYETGAILGCAEPNRLTELISMSFSADKHYCQEEVKYLLRRRLETSGRYAHSFYTFYLHGTMRDMNMSFDIGDMKKAHSDMRYGAEIRNFMEYAGTEGLLLGSWYPDLAEQMYGHRYGLQEDVIHEMIGGVCILPVEDMAMPLRDREQVILDRVSEFVSRHHSGPAGYPKINSNSICCKDGESGMEMRQLVEAYLDIETTGLSRTNCYITVIGVNICQNGKSDVVQLVGRDINAESILEVLQGVDTIYTYNGSRFDLPFIQACLGVNLAANYSHIDLMYHCWKNNLRGGLKSVERQLGIARELTDVNGYEAVRLWWRYLDSFDMDALDKLLKYNAEDVVNLRLLKEKLL